MSCQVSEWSTYTAQRRHVRCRSRDPSRLRHHLLVSTYVSPVGPIRVVCGAGDPSWLQKTKRHQSSAVCGGVTVASMSRSWRDWGLVPLPCSQKETESISGGLMVYSNIQVDLTAGESVATVLQLQSFATSGVHQLFNSTRRTVMSKHFMIT